MKESSIHEIFEISILLKGAHAMLECVSGILLVFISTSTIVSVVKTLTQEELIEDPHDLIATGLLNYAQHFSVSTAHFYAIYLLSHGIVKLLLVIGLLKDMLWAYPASLAALGLFILYQLYRYSYSHGIGLIVLTVFDLAVMILIWHEYRLVRRYSRK
ncbi:MAG: DUF2127 domain-containing protein [Aestuariivirga sp.]